MVRLALDLGPLLVFYLAFRQGGVYLATYAIIAATAVSLAITYLVERRIAALPLVTGLLVTIMGGLTLYLHNDTFIKMKPTLLNLFFAFALLGGLAFKKPLFKSLLGGTMPLKDEGWRQLSLRWGLYFLMLAVLNEIIWRNFSLDFWVKFKVFGMFTLTMLFTCLQIPLIQRYWIEEEKKP